MAKPAPRESSAGKWRQAQYTGRRGESSASPGPKEGITFLAACLHREENLQVPEQLVSRPASSMGGGFHERVLDSPGGALTGSTADAEHRLQGHPSKGNSGPCPLPATSCLPCPLPLSSHTPSLRLTHPRRVTLCDVPPDEHAVPKSLAHHLCRANGARSPRPTILATTLHYGVSLNPTSAPNAAASSPPVRGTAGRRHGTQTCP